MYKLQTMAFSRVYLLGVGVRHHKLLTVPGYLRPGECGVGSILLLEIGVKLQPTSYCCTAFKHRLLYFRSISLATFVQGRLTILRTISTKEKKNRSLRCDRLDRPMQSCTARMGFLPSSHPPR